MYRKPGDKLKLANLLPKLRGGYINKPAPYVPVIHAQADKNAAKRVLERLLAGTSTNEILSINEITPVTTHG